MGSIEDRDRDEGHLPGSARDRGPRKGRKSNGGVPAPAAGVAAPAAVAATAATAAARCPRASFIDREATAVMVLAVQALDGRQGLVIIDHFHEAESPAPSRLAIAQDLAAAHRPV